MPANMPIAQQRVVQGEAFRRVPGASTSYESPEWSWEGVVDALDISPSHRMRSSQTYDEVTVDWDDGFDDDVEFDILVNNSVVETINTGSGDSNTFSVTPIVVVRDDRIKLEMTDFGAGVGVDLTVGLRRSV